MFPYITPTTFIRDFAMHFLLPFHYDSWNLQPEKLIQNRTERTAALHHLPPARLAVVTTWDSLVPALPALLAPLTPLTPLTPHPSAPSAAIDSSAPTPRASVTAQVLLDTAPLPPLALPVPLLTTTSTTRSAKTAMKTNAEDEAEDPAEAMEVDPLEEQEMWVAYVIDTQTREVLVRSVGSARSVRGALVGLLDVLIRRGAEI